MPRLSGWNVPGRVCQDKLNEIHYSTISEQLIANEAPSWNRNRKTKDYVNGRLPFRDKARLLINMISSLLQLAYSIVVNYPRIELLYVIRQWIWIRKNGRHENWTHNKIEKKWNLFNGNYCTPLTVINSCFFYLLIARYEIIRMMFLMGSYPTIRHINVISIYVFVIWYN